MGQPGGIQANLCVLKSAVNLSEHGLGTYDAAVEDNLAMPTEHSLIKAFNVTRYPDSRVVGVN
jgi:hypothetical protein